MKTGILLSIMALVWIDTHAASHRDVMFSRYLKYQFCLERTFKPGPSGHGAGVYKRMGLDTVLNRWGTSEPKSSAIAAASLRVREADTRCRIENALENEPRPD